MKYSNPSSDTAILLFSLSAEEQLKEKVFSLESTIEQNQLIAQAFISRSLSVAKQSGFPVYHHSEKDQKGLDFGEKLAHSLEVIYGHGYEKVIVIGNDCPQLTPESLRNAASDLSESGLVLGETGNGGAYLLGIEEKNYNREAFVQLPWRHTGLVEAWKEYAQENQVSISWLEVLADVNNSLDLDKALSDHSINQSFRKLLKSILQKAINYSVTYVVKSVLTESNVTFGLRAPPLAA